ncbi:MAG TPA: Hsp70 family protein [Polyangiaceae bacterium]
MQLGIDFGTTRTVVAMADRGNYPVVDFVDQHGDAQSAIPSMVAAKDGELRFGFAAMAVATDPDWAVLPSFKRLFATGAGASHVVRVGDTTIAFGDLLENFFVHVRDAVKKRVRSKSTAMRAAVAVPANALGAQRLVTLDAFRRAGFDAFAMLNEPSAAGFEYTHRHRNTLSSRRDLVVVYDLGGGTFDASAVRMTGTTHEVTETAGLPRLGGDDFDEVLAKTALLQVDLDLAELPSRPRRMLLAQCRDAKEALHPSSRKIAVDLEAALGKLAPKPEVVVQAADYYDACLPLVERTIAAMEPLLAGEENGLAGIYVVGGASELPVVSRVLRERFGRRVHRSPYPSAAVAIGLAIAADTDAELTLVDRYARTFGVFREAEAGREITFDAIFAPDTALPARASRLTRTRAYRAAHNVGHYRFFECSALDAAGKPRGDMTLFGDVHFPFDANVESAATTPVARRASEGPRIEESYSLDERGIVEVVIRNLDQGYERSFKLGA